MQTIVQSAATELFVSMDGKRPTPIVRDAHALLVRGIDALERNHIDEAVGLLRQTVELDADSFYGQLALGIALTKALQIPAAEQALEAAIRLEPKNFYAHLRMAELFQRVGVPTKTEEELRIALDLAQTAEEKKIARDLLGTEERRDPRRAWRPDFSKLLRRPRRAK
jgi:tetratricopeptide (TPR) repeat protein